MRKDGETMRTTIAILTLLLASVATAPPLRAADDGADVQAAIEAVIEKAYVHGIWLDGDEAVARSGFDPSFVMQVAQEDHVLSVSLDDWLARLGLHGEPLDENITHRIEVLDHSGTAAVALVEVHRDGQPLYTDYMSLYRSGDGWRIVAKIFHSHPQ